MEKEIIYNLKGKELYKAGFNRLVTDEDRKKLIDKLDGFYLFLACSKWPGITDEDRNRLKDRLERWELFITSILITLILQLITIYLNN